MTSSRLILIFLAFIFLIIVVLSSNRISAALRNRFAGVLPSMNATTEEITPTPTIESISPSPTPTPTTIYGGAKTKGNSPTAKNIPATGPEDFLWVLLSGSFFTGVALKKTSFKKN